MAGNRLSSYGDKSKNNSSSYGAEHRESRKIRLSKIDQTKCELSGRGINNDGEMHHIVTKLHGGPDWWQNYRHTEKNIHQKFIHGLCNVDDPESVRSRIIYSRALLKHILDDEKREAYHEKVRELDETLIHGYIDNMINNLPEWLSSNVHRETLISNFETIRDLTILKKYYETVIEKMRKKLQDAGLDID